MLLKKRQALIVIELSTRATVKHGILGLPVKERVFQDECFLELRDLNKRGAL